MLELLQYQSKIFDAENISYWLDEGTLLGSIRHNGWIPNDYDIDIAILESDVEKVKQIKDKFSKCGYLLTRDSCAWINWIFPYTPYIILRNQFRLFKSYLFIPYYVDVRDYNLREDIIYDKDFMDDTGYFPIDQIFPLKKCVFEGTYFSCPKNCTYVLEKEYGLNWRVPCSTCKTSDNSPESRGKPKHWVGD